MRMFFVSSLTLTCAADLIQLMCGGLVSFIKDTCWLSKGNNIPDNLILVIYKITKPAKYIIKFKEKIKG